MAEGIDWGSVADWVGAIGGVSGACTAAAFYFLDRRRARNAEVASLKEAKTRERDLKIHVHGLTRDASQAARLYLACRYEQGALTDLRASFKVVESSADRIQKMANLPLSLHLDICDLIEAIGDTRIIGKDFESINDAIEVARYATEVLKEKLEAELGITEPS